MKLYVWIKDLGKPFSIARTLWAISLEDAREQAIRLRTVQSDNKNREESEGEFDQDDHVQELDHRPDDIPSV